MELRRSRGLGSRRIAKILKEDYGVSMSVRGISRWLNEGRTPLRGVAKEILNEPTALRLVYEQRGYEQVSLEEKLRLREEALQFHSIGYGPRSIVTILRLRHGVQISVKTIAGWIYRRCQPRLKTILAPSPELATIAAASISDGTISEGHRIHFAIQMKDPEPVKLIVECLKKVTGRNKYQLSYLPSRDAYRIYCYRKDLCDYLRNKNNIIELLRKYPKDFIKMFFEAEGAPSATIVRCKHKHSNISGLFNAGVVAVNSDIELLRAIQWELEALKIQAYIRLGTKAGTVREIRGKKAIFKKDCYRLDILRKDSVIRYGEEIGFISRRKREKLNDIIDILRMYGKTERGAVEWIRRYEYRSRGREKWVKRRSPLTHGEAISALKRHLRGRLAKRYRAKQR